jgi:uncharacterized protein
VTNALPIEGFALETHGGLIFTVKGLVHPPGRFVAYLRYAPDATGGREREGRRYRRVGSFEEQRSVLEAQPGPYLAYDSAAGAALQGVPRGDVRHVHDPCRRLRELVAHGPSDAVEEQALALAERVREAAGLPHDALGVTGSLLVGLQAPDSDVDLVVYGDAWCRAAHDALRGLLAERGSGLRRPRGGELTELHAAHLVETPLAAADFERMQAGKVNEGSFGGRSFFVRFVKRPHEIDERYGEPAYEPLGAAVVAARVTDAADAPFTPCRYGVGDVTILEGAAAPRLREIVSFRGRFADQARAGDRVRARGTLERVVRPDVEAYQRLLVGGAGDYLLRELQ